MIDGGLERLKWAWIWLAVFLAALPLCRAANSRPGECARVVIEAEVSAGHEWNTPIGEGWVFRVLPISPLNAGYSGWDLVVDRQQPAGYPDALLLATAPYNSINEREIGTTFGLRAQDAIGWNPRTFHFLSRPADFREGQRLFRMLMENQSRPKAVSRASGSQMPVPNPDPEVRLLALLKAASSGEFRILDAHLVPGIADPAPYAQGWALASSRTPHEVETVPAGNASARGRLDWMRFALTLWLPSPWTVPPGVRAVRAACPE